MTCMPDHVRNSKVAFTQGSCSNNRRLAAAKRSDMLKYDYPANKFYYTDPLTHSFAIAYHRCATARWLNRLLCDDFPTCIAPFAL